MTKIQPKQRCGTCHVKYLLHELSLCGCKMSICDKCQNKVEHLFHSTIDDDNEQIGKKLIICRRLSKLLGFNIIKNNNVGYANFFTSVNVHVLLSHTTKYLPHMIISRHDTGIVDNVQLIWWEVSNRPLDYYKHGLSKIFYGRTINEALIFALLYHLERESSNVD